MLKFGTAKIPKLSKANLVNTEVHLLIQYIHQLLRQEAFDDSVLGNLIDSETITLLGYVFAPTEKASRHPITSHWTIDWDVATIIEVLEELYPLQAEHRHLDFGSRWQQVIDNSVSRVRVQSDRMEQVRSDTTHFEWNHLPFDVISVRNRAQYLPFINEGRLINWCEVCKRTSHRQLSPC